MPSRFVSLDPGLDLIVSALDYMERLLLVLAGGGAPPSSLAEDVFEHVGKGSLATGRRARDEYGGNDRLHHEYLS